MRPTEDLEAFLQSRRNEGSRQDTASFTLDQLKAREKLADFQLGDSGLWIVKMVQAAVASGAPRIDIAFARRKVTVRFAPTTPWSADEILQAVMSGALPSERALSHLVTGIRSCAANIGESVTWRAGGVEVSLFPTECKVREVPQSGIDFVLEAGRPPRGVPWRSLLVVPLEQVIRQTLEEWMALHRRCWLCPIPVFVDGQSLLTGYDVVPRVGHHTGVPRRATKLHICLGHTTLSQPEFRPSIPSSLLPVVTEQPLVNPKVGLAGTFLCWTPARERVTGFLSLHASGAVVPSVEFYLDGAVVESRLISQLVEASRKQSLLTRGIAAPRFLFPVEFSEVDLGGFAVRELDHEELFFANRDAAIELVEMVEDYRSSYRATAVDAHKLISQGLGLLKRQLLEA